MTRRGQEFDKSWYRHLMWRKRQANVHVGLQVWWWTMELGWVNPRHKPRHRSGK